MRNVPEVVWPPACPDAFLRLAHLAGGEHPGVFDDNLLRTLQRRLGQWRAQKARQLIFGVENDAVAPSLTSLTDVLVDESTSIG